jgi:hypothetical protein
MRTVEIQYMGELHEVRKRTEGKIDDAIGYLSMWALHDTGLAYVSIMITSHDCEAAALYKRSKDAQGGFLMVAVWREAEKRYSFHT